MQNLTDSTGRLSLPVIAAVAVLIFPTVLITVLGPIVIQDRIAQGTLYSFMSLGGLAGTVIAGFSLRRLQPLTLFRAGLIGSAVCLMMLSTTPLQGLLLLALCSCIAVVGTTQMVLLSLLFPAIPRRIMALSLAANATASALFPMIATALLEASARFGFTAASALGCGDFLCAVATIAVYFGARNCHALPAMSSRRETSSKCASSTIVFGVLLCVLHVTTDNLLSQWSMPHFMSAYPHPEFPAPLILSACAVAYLVARLGLAAMPERNSQPELLYAPGIIGALLLWSSFLCGSYIGAATLYVSAALFYGLEYPTLLGRIANCRRTPSPRSSRPERYVHTSWLRC